MDHACGDHVLVTRHGKGDVLAGQELPAQGEGFFRSKESQELDRAQLEWARFHTGFLFKDAQQFG